VNKAVSEMDKVTQQNAASAEESASASEEMSAQAETMKAMVNDLLTMVGGVSKRMRTCPGRCSAKSWRQPANSKSRLRNESSEG